MTNTKQLLNIGTKIRIPGDHRIWVVWTIEKKRIEIIVADSLRPESLNPISKWISVR